MMTRRIATRLLIAVCCLSIATPALFAGRKGKAKTEPGSYREWGGEIDEVEVVQKFDLKDYDKLVIAPLDTADTPLPEKKDNTYAPVKQVLASPNDSFLAGLKDELSSKTLAIREGENGGSGALIVRAKIDEMDPGSQAARYFAGFGAGAARTKITGEIVDAKTNQVLLRFTQERRSGVGMMGGDYVSLMNRNLKAIGEDLAFILNSF